MTVLRFDDNRGSFAYSFLPTELQWQIVSHSFDKFMEGGLHCGTFEPTLRWVKDDKVLDLHVPGMDTAAFLQRAGLQLSLHNGGYVLSKRLSRVIRPYRYYGFFNENEIHIDYNEYLDAQLWDGSGQVSRGFIQRLADSLDLDERHRRELLHTNRFEVTTLHAGGQDKGHVLVVDDLAVDFMFPAGSVKKELSMINPSTSSGQASRIFIGLNPVHSEDQMCLDIQSLINLYPFFQPEHLLAWAEIESELFLQGIENGRLASILNRLYDADSVADLDSLADWHVGEYIASGGNLMWFAGMVKAVAKQHLKRLGSRLDKLRCPVPGGRYYIFPAAVGKRHVPQGQVELDPTCATAWVNDQDWLTYIVDVLGGCDGDDAVWVFPFADTSDGGQAKMLIWRSPNQVGEYVVLQPTANSHQLAWETAQGTLPLPKMKSHLLPKRIDSTIYQYGTLPEASDQYRTDVSYSIGTMASTIARAAANQGVLGGFCNVAMLCKAMYGRLPQNLPATLEAVIDGSVKSGLDLSPVKAWNQMALQRMVTHGQQNPLRGMPNILRARLPHWLQQQAQPADGHWLDSLTNALERHKAQYWADVQALATEACPPIALFEQGRDWMHMGKELRQEYGCIMRCGVQDEAHVPDLLFAQARCVSESFLQQWPEEKRPYLLLGVAAYLYAQGSQQGEPVRDALLWQLGAKEVGDRNGRNSGIAQMMLAALRHIGLLGEPMWTTSGGVLYYQDEPPARCVGVPVRLNGVWLNLLNATNKQPYTRMSDVPTATRTQAKARIDDYVQDKFRGLMLTTEVTDHNRVVTRTPHGNLFGYVQKDHELAAIRHARWEIAWATAVDGNVLAVLEPAG